MTAENLLPLPGTGWHVWESAVLRAPGFPAAGLDRLAASDCAKVADAYLAGDTDKAAYAAEFDRTVRALAAQLCGIAADPLFREAVTWQSRDSVAALDGLVRTGPTGSRNWRQREREVLVTRYWQRYCAKNDTIGFFGPVCWARFEADGPTVTARSGPALVRQRAVDLEWRAVAAFADKLAADPRYRPWLPVVRRPHLALDGDRLLRIGASTQVLSPAALALVEASDGTRTARQVAAAAMADGRTGLRKEADAFLLLAQLADQGTVHWGLRLAHTVMAMEDLRRGLDAIEEPNLREEALAGLNRLEVARASVAAAAGDADALCDALRRLDEEYVAVAGMPAAHRPGATYAGRGVAYEDTQRDLDVTFGGQILSDLAPALALVLQAARWLSVAIADTYGSALRELYHEAGRETVPVGELSYLANGIMFTERLATDVMADFSQRWERVLGLSSDPTDRVDLDSATLASAMAEAFPADAPGWSAARLHSPDLHICAESVAALERGDFTAVLGEMHVAWLTSDSQTLVRYHSDRDALRGAVYRDLGDRIVLLYPTDYPEFTARLAPALTNPDDHLLAYADAPAPTLDGVLPLAGLTASLVDGELVARSPDGRVWPIVELFGPFLSALAANAFKLISPRAHTPRVTVDRLVLQRETWRTTIGESGLASAGSTEADRYLAVRRWRAALGLPERVFAKVGTEVKPCFVDFTSPAYVAAFLAMVRSALRAGGEEVALIVSEMLPTTEQAWVPDGDGRRYLSELRLTVRDPMPARTASERGTS